MNVRGAKEKLTADVPHIPTHASGSPRSAVTIAGTSESLYVPLMMGENNNAKHELGTLLLGFYRYYASEFNFGTTVDSISRDRDVTKAELGWTTVNEKLYAKNPWDRVHCVMCIEDPYEKKTSTSPAESMTRRRGPSEACF